MQVKVKIKNLCLETFFKLTKFLTEISGLKNNVMAV